MRDRDTAIQNIFQHDLADEVPGWQRLLAALVDAEELAIEPDPCLDPSRGEEELELRLVSV
jgi:hypothetical protein